MASLQGTAPAPPAVRRRSGSIVGPAILILLGALLLGQSLGWVSSSVWRTVLDLWPVFLILVGLELILGRGSIVGAVVLGVVAALFLAIASFATTVPSEWRWVNVGPFAPVETIRMSEEVGQTKRATYQLEFGAGSMTVSALAPRSANLVDATLERDDKATIERSVDRQGDLATVTIRGRREGPATWPATGGRTQMMIGLSPLVPGELRVDGGAGDLSLDLSAIPLTYVEVDAGVGKTKVVLPQTAGRTSTSINLGVGETEVTVPEGVAAQIRVDTGIGGTNIDQSRFPKVGEDTYRSVNYDTATNRVDLYVSGGIGQIIVK